MHEHLRRASAAQKVHDNVQHLGVQDGWRLEMLSRSGGAGEDKYSRADDGADAESGERPRAQSFLQAMPRLVSIIDELVDGLAA